MGHGWSFWRLAMGRDACGVCAGQVPMCQGNQSRLLRGIHCLPWLFRCVTPITPGFNDFERRQGKALIEHFDPRDERSGAIHPGLLVLDEEAFMLAAIRQSHRHLTVASRPALRSPSGFLPIHINMAQTRMIQGMSLRERGRCGPLVRRTVITQVPHGGILVAGACWVGTGHIEKNATAGTFLAHEVLGRRCLGAFQSTIL